MSTRHDISWSTTQWRGTGNSGQDDAIHVPTMSQHNDLFSFLAIAQYYDIEFVNIEWGNGPEPLGRGGTAEVRERSFAESRGYAFKRHRGLAPIRSNRVGLGPKHGEDPAFDEKVFNELVAELTVLGHPLIRNHQNFVRLEGIYWEVPMDDSDPWPVLVFEKAQQGDMWSFGQSTQGLWLDFEQRVRICLDIAQAISTLHELDMVHGDIKPQNILIFLHKGWNRDDQVVPDFFFGKLADFGYAGWNMDPSRDVHLHLPESKPWSAPEYHHRAFGLHQAKQLEIFSFGLTCLWFLFQDKLISTRDQSEILRKYSENAFLDPEAIEEFKVEGLLPKLASEFISTTSSVPWDMRQHLRYFFESTLNSNPDDRSLSIDSLVMAAGLETAYNLKCQDVAQGNLDQATVTFSLANSFLHLIHGRYRIRSFIAARLEKEAVTGRTSNSRRNAAFQYALCCKIGFGRVASVEDCRRWLAQSNLDDDHLNTELELIKRQADNKRERTGALSEVRGMGEITERVGSSPTEQRRLNNMIQELKDLSATFGEHVWAIRSLRSKVIGRLIDANRAHDAEGIAAHYVELYAKRAVKDAQVQSSANKDISTEAEAREQQTYERMRLRDQQAFERVAGNLQIPQPVSFHQSAEFTTIFTFVKTLPPEDLNAVVNLADVYCSLKRWKEAETLLVYCRKAASSRYHDFEGMMPKIIALLAKLYLDTHRLRESERVYNFLNKAYTLYPQEFSPATTWSRQDLAKLYRQRGRLDKAEAMYNALVEESSRLNGDTHLITRYYTYQLASFYGNHKRYREAETLLTQLVNLREVSDYSVQELQKNLCDLGVILSWQNRLAEADTFLRASLDTEFAKEHSSGDYALKARTRLAMNLFKRGEVTGAQYLLEQVLEEQNVALSMEDGNVLAMKRCLSHIYHAERRFKEEEQLFLPTIQAFARHHGPRHPVSVDWKHTLAKVYFSQNRFLEAEEIQVDVITIKSEYMNEDHPDLLRSELLLANISFKQRRLRQTTNSLIGKLDLLKRRLPETHNEILEAFELLVACFCLQKRWRDAEAMNLEHLKVINGLDCDHRFEHYIDGIGVRASLLLLMGRWTDAIIFIILHLKVLLRWCWIELKWDNVRIVLPWLISPRNFPNNAYLVSFLLVAGFTLIFALARLGDVASRLVAKSLWFD